MDKFKLRYPEFTNVPDGVLNVTMEDARMDLCKKIWGKYYERGWMALTAHNLWLKGYLDDLDDDGNPISDGGAKRSVASRTAGSLSISYGGTTCDGFGNGNTYGYEESVYGREYLRLLYMVTPGWVVIR